MKKIYFGSNLKMYKGIAATTEYLQELAEKTKDISREEIELFIIPSYTSLQAAAACCADRGIKIGAQNMCWKNRDSIREKYLRLCWKSLECSLL